MGPIILHILQVLAIQTLSVQGLILGSKATASMGLMALVILLEGRQHLEPGIAINIKSSPAPPQAPAA